MWNITRELMRRESGLFPASSTSFINRCNSSMYVAGLLGQSQMMYTIFRREAIIRFDGTGKFLCIFDGSGFAIYDWFNARKLTYYYVYVPSHMESLVDLSDVQFVNDGNMLNIFLGECNGCIDNRRILPTGFQALLNRVFLYDSRVLLNHIDYNATIPLNVNEAVCVTEAGGVYQLDFRTKQDIYEPVITIPGGISPYSLAHHPFKPEFMFSSFNGHVRFYDPRNLKKELRSWQLYTSVQHVLKTQYNFDGTEILINADSNVRLTNEPSKEIKEFKYSFIPHPHTTTYYGSKSEYILVIKEDKILIVDKITTNSSQSITVDFDYGVQSYTPHPNTPSIAVGDVTGAVCVYTPRIQLKDNEDYKNNEYFAHYEDYEHYDNDGSYEVDENFEMFVNYANYETAGNELQFTFTTKLI